jgi:hypothetical protein
MNGRTNSMRRRDLSKAVLGSIVASPFVPKFLIPEKIRNEYHYDRKCSVHELNKFEINPIPLECGNCGRPLQIGKTDTNVWVFGCFENGCRGKEPVTYHMGWPTCDMAAPLLSKIMYKYFEYKGVKTKFLNHIRHKCEDRDGNIMEEGRWEYNGYNIGIHYIPSPKCNCVKCVVLRNKYRDGSSITDGDRRKYIEDQKKNRVYIRVSDGLVMNFETMRKTRNEKYFVALTAKSDVEGFDFRIGYDNHVNFGDHCTKIVEQEARIGWTQFCVNIG